MSHHRLLAALDRLAADGRTARFWLRDDDAVSPSPALDRLLGLLDRQATPATLAVIPEQTGPALATLLEDHPAISVAVHGWSHRSYSAPPEKKQELGMHRPLAIVLQELSDGLVKLFGLHGARCIDMLVPPWNRIAPELVAELPSLGFRSLSVFGLEKPSPIALLNTHVDIMDWHGTYGGRPHEVLLAEVAALIETSPPATIGLLTHHLVHDETAWGFIEDFLAMTSGHPACQWTSAMAALDQNAI